MRIQFTWQAEEWREAYLLATAKPERRAGAPSMAYLVLGAMALGGGADLLHTLYVKQGGRLHGTLFPALLAGVALCGLLLLGLHRLRERKRMRDLPTIPEGVQKVVLQESGWKVDVEDQAPGAMREWQEMGGQRRGDTVIALLPRDGGLAGVPLRAMDEEQDGSLHRLLLRKLTPPVE